MKFNSCKKLCVCSCALSFDSSAEAPLVLNQMIWKKKKNLSKKAPKQDVKNVSFLPLYFDKIKAATAFSTSLSPWWRDSSHIASLQFIFSGVSILSYHDLFWDVFTQKCYLISNIKINLLSIKDNSILSILCLFIICTACHGLQLSSVTKENCTWSELKPWICSLSSCATFQIKIIWSILQVYDSFQIWSSILT